MNWQLPVRKALLMGDYPAVAEFYEQAIEREHGIVSHYWYLGLAYLLQEQVEEAQSIWIFALTQASTEEEPTALLLGILETEAQRQEEAKNVFLSALIRRQLLELDMTAIDNLLQLIRLEIDLNTYTPELLEEWQVVETLTNTNDQKVDSALVLLVLAKILEFPSVNSINFAAASLAYINDSESLCATIMQVASRMAYDELKPTYAADLTKICLEVQPDNPYLLNELLSFYSFAKKHDEAIETAQKIYNELDRICSTISLKLHSVYRVLMTYISIGAWLEIDPIVKRYRHLLLEMAKHPPQTIESFLKGRLLGVVFPLFYLSDRASENRYIINRIAKVFQDNLELNLLSIKNPVLSQSIQSHSKLRIGYIAHTLRKHSVGWLSRWLFQYHDRDRFEIFIYLINQPEDEITQSCFREKADCTHNFSRYPEKIAQQIQEDGINILVDLDSLTHNLTYQVLALKPAPIQVTWLGFDATGLPTVDYFIADPYVLPENAQDYYQEAIWRLPKTYIAIDGFEVGEVTLSRQQLDIPDEAIIYFSLQNGFKRHPDTIRLQMQILQAVPNSYMLIKGAANDEIIQQLFQQLALESAIDPNRLRFLSQDRDELTHRANLQIADVVLDTYPYNGATTTLEVLWMEIPLVTRVGEQFAARNSYSFLTNVGVTEGIARTDEEYIAWGILLGQNPDLRQQVKQKLKESKQKSPLWKAREFTEQMENAYQQMWEKLIVDS